MNRKKLIVTLAFGLALSGALYALAPKGEDAWPDLPHGVYVAHRGLTSRTTPENTLQAFREAAETPEVWGIEFDIWESTAKKSGNTDEETPLLLVSHDRDISLHYTARYRTDVRKLTRKGRTQYKNRKNGEVIPELEEALETIWVRSPETVPFIEVKGAGVMSAGYVDPDAKAACLTPEALAYLIDYVGAHGTEVYILSFDYGTVRDAAKLARAKEYAFIHTMYLDADSYSLYAYTMSGDPDWLPANLREDGIDAYCTAYTGVKDRAMVERFHEAGILTGVYNVPDARTARRLAEIEVDFLIPLTVLK